MSAATFVGQTMNRPGDHLMTRIVRWIGAAVVALTATGASAEIVYYHNDLAGSPIAATNAAGRVIWRESYRPYGERLVNAPASSGNKVWYTSRRQDAETGLVYMGARYYDPVVGRFMSTDAVHFQEGYVHSFNRYAYANNNPYRYVDPDGNHPVVLAIATILRAAAQRAVTFALTRGAQTAVRAGEIGAGEAIGAGTVGVTAAKGVSAGRSVLGHYPEYAQVAETLGARHFNVPKDVWEKMSDAERWIANQKFLDRMVSRGDDIILATPLDRIREGSFYARELEYLGSKGLAPNGDGTKLIRKTLDE